MRRREFIGLLGGAVVWPIAARAEQQRSLPRIGYLGLGSAADPRYEGEFLAGLRDLGYVEGKTIEIEFRFSGGDPDEVDKAAADFVKGNVDVIVAAATGVYAARRATSTIPIVMAAAGDAVAMGLAASLARPGGNVTGSNFFLPELMAKRLELLKEILPSMSSAGTLFRRGVASTPNILEVMRAAAKPLGVDLSPIEVSGPEQVRERVRELGGTKSWRRSSLSIYSRPRAPRSPRSPPSAVSLRSGRLELAAAGGLIGYGVDFPRCTAAPPYLSTGSSRARSPATSRSSSRRNSDRRQSQDRQSARDRHSADAARRRRRGDRMRRRAFMRLLGAAAAWPLAARAQSKPMPIVGILDPDVTFIFDAFVEGMRDLGYVEGRNIAYARKVLHGNLPSSPRSRPSWSIRRWMSSSPCLRRLFAPSSERRTRCRS